MAKTSSKRRASRASLLAALLATATTGCTDDADPASTGTATSGATTTSGAGGAPPADDDVVEGAPREGTAPPTTVSDLGADVTTSGVVRADAAFGTAEGAFRVALATGEIADVDVYDDESGELAGAGAVRAIARRGDGGAFIATADGLFHDQDGVLLRSPFEPGDVTWLDARTTSLGDEELWIVAEGEARHVGGTVDTVSIDGFAIERLVGVGDGRALVASGGALLTLDLASPNATLEAAELGAIASMTRAEDDTVWVGTSAGLVRRAPDGATTRFTLAAPGAAPIAVRAVAAAYGAVAAVTDAGLVGVDADGPFLVDASVADATAVAIDGAGDVWTAVGTTITRHATARPVTFAASVAPFLAERCGACHESGASNAPVLDLADYDEVVLLAPDLAQRATSASMPMPPTGLLPSYETAPLLRWIATGLAP